MMDKRSFLNIFQQWRADFGYPKREECREFFRNYRDSKEERKAVEWCDYVLKQEKPAMFLDSLFKKDSEISIADKERLQEENVDKNYEEILEECYLYIKTNNLIPTFADISNPEAKKIFKNEENLLQELANKYQDLSTYILNENSFDKNYNKEVIKKIKNYNRFVITTAVSNKKVNKNFLNSIKNYCYQNDALLLILPCADVANRRTSVKWQLDPILKEFPIIYNDTFLNENLMISDIKMSAKHINPLQGLKHLCQEKTVIIANTKQELEFIPTFVGTQPHCLMTTGAITLGDYNNDLFMSKRTSKLAEYDHVTGAIIVEKANNKIFHFRQIQADKEGSFIDLGKHYYPNNDICVVVGSTMITGDSHFGEEDKQVIEATKDMIEELSITDLVMSDVITCDSISHWKKNQTITSAIQSKNNKISLEEEANMVANRLDEFADLVNEIIIPYSNHHVFLDRYLEDGRYAFDKVNLRYSLDIVKAMIDGEVLPVKFMIENQTNLRNKKKLKWLKPTEGFEKFGFELSQHHLGANGAKGNLQTYRNSFKKSVSGHTHVARIFKNAVSVGTNSKLKLDYNKGLSSWTNTNCIIYPNGTFQLINIINNKGKYSWKI